MALWLMVALVAGAAVSLAGRPCQRSAPPSTARPAAAAPMRARIPWLLVRMVVVCVVIAVSLRCVRVSDGRMLAAHEARAIAARCYLSAAPGGGRAVPIATSCYAGRV